MYYCERCKADEALKGEKFCKACKKRVIAEMRESGYLRYVSRAHTGCNRTAEAREITQETKFGKDR